MTTSGQRLSRICIDPMMTLVLIGLGVGLVVPNVLHRPNRAAVGALALMAGGLCCLTLAKSSLWRQGIWASWGSRGMTKGYASLYKWEWAGIGAGVLLLLLTWRI